MIDQKFLQCITELFNQPLTSFHNPFENARQGQFERYVVNMFRTWLIHHNPRMHVFCEFSNERYDMTLVNQSQSELTHLEFKSSHGMGNLKNNTKQYFDKALEDVNKLYGVYEPRLPNHLTVAQPITFRKYVIATWIEIYGQNPDPSRSGIVDGVMAPNFKPDLQRIDAITEELLQMAADPSTWKLQSIKYGMQKFMDQEMAILWSVMEVK
jgi:hypothetical protein